jgi:hypothetical protein
MKISEKFDARKSEIESHPTLVDSFIRLLKADKDFSIGKTEKQIGKKIPADLVGFYSSCNGLKFIWEIIHGTRRVTGHSFILSHENFFSKKLINRNGDSLGFYNKSTPQKVKKELEDFFVFDIVQYDNYVLCKWDGHEDETKLFLYLSDGRLLLLNLSLQDYLEKMLEYGGIYLWQRHFCTDFLLSALDIEDGCIESLPFIFKQVDVSGLKIYLSNLPAILSKTDYRQGLESKIKAFTKDKKVKVRTLEIRHGAPIGYLAKAQYALGKKLPDSIWAFFYQLNGLRFDWSKGQHGGSINIYPIENMLGGAADDFGQDNKDWLRPSDYLNILWFEGDPNEDLLKIIRPLDVPIGTHNFVGIKPSDFSLYFSEARNETQKLPLDFDQYLQFLMEYLGVLHWQCLFTKSKDLKIGTFKLTDYIKETFPNSQLPS